MHCATVKCKLKSTYRELTGSSTHNLLKVEVGPRNQRNVAFVGSLNDSNNYTGEEEAIFLRGLLSLRYLDESRFYIGCNWESNTGLEEMRKMCLRFITCGLIIFSCNNNKSK